MKLRFPFTVALATALLATPVVAQSTFHWHAGDDLHVRIRVSEQLSAQVERTVERAARQASIAAERVARHLEDALERAAGRVEHRDEHLADRIHDRIHHGIAAHVRSLVDAHVGASSWAFSAEQSFDSDPCRNQGRRDRDDYYTHCEVREERLPAGPLNVNAAPNGGIQVQAWDRNEIYIRAIVQAHAEDLDTARQIATGVQVQAGGGRVTASGPQPGRREWWSVSYRINVPRQADLDLNSINGGISIAGVTGTIRFDTTNGGVTLTDLAGSVRGSTNNGGLSVSLGGERWDGEGLDVDTSNGGVTLSIPDNYNAQLETRTVNGGFRFDYPMTLVGDLTPRRGISTTLGAGGPMVRVRTNNGGLKIQRR
jgi:hypothetical protein